MINLPNGLFDFQEACSLFLVDKVGLQDSKQTIKQLQEQLITNIKKYLDKWE